jgi:hypothetical protein
MREVGANLIGARRLFRKRVFDYLRANQSKSNGPPGHDNPKASEQSWTWMLGYLTDPSPADSKSHGMGGMGIQSTAKLTARDVCMTVWDDVDPNHFKKPGGKIE